MVPLDDIIGRNLGFSQTVGLSTFGFPYKRSGVTPLG